MPISEPVIEERYSATKRLVKRSPNSMPRSDSSSKKRQLERVAPTGAKEATQETVEGASEEASDYSEESNPDTRTNLS